MKRQTENGMLDIEFTGQRAYDAQRDAIDFRIRLDAANF
jgi:hypothetical protein